MAGHLGSTGMYIADPDDARRHMKIIVEEVEQTNNAVVNFAMAVNQLESLGKTLTDVIGKVNEMKLIAKEATDTTAEANLQFDQFVGEVEEIAENDTILM